MARMKQLLKRALRRLGGVAGVDELHISQRHQLERLTRALRDVEYQTAVAPDGYALPPAALQFLVSGHYDTSVAEFLEMGRWCADSIATGVRTAGSALEERRAILDFGCGCGRILRHLPSMTGSQTAFYGTDYNPRLIEWCQRHLHFAKFSLNGLEPPLAYADASFDLAYAFSVFTHLTEPLQRGWMDELFRVLQPGGVLVITVLGAAYADTYLSPQERNQFDAGQMLTKNPTSAGENACTLCHPERYVRDVLSKNFEVRAFQPGRVVDASRLVIAQDVYALLRAAAPHTTLPNRADYRASAPAASV
jgi:SAM-dependent methyltransferase